MGVRITGQEGVVAFFDSASGFAFGPTFGDSDEAQEFLDWLAAGQRDDRVIPDGIHKGDDLRFLADPRIYNSGELKVLHALWTREREE